VLQAPCSGLFSCILSWSDRSSPVLQAPLTRLSYNQPSTWSVVSSSLFWSSLSRCSHQVLCCELPVLVRSIKLLVLSYPIMVSCIKSCVSSNLSWSSCSIPNKSRVASSSHSAILSRCSLWSVVSSPVMQAPCFEQAHHGLFSYILQPAIIMVSCIKLSVLGYPIMVSSIKSCDTSSLFRAALLVLFDQILASSLFQATHHAVLNDQILTSPVLQALRFEQTYQASCYKLLVPVVLSCPLLVHPTTSHDHGQF